MLRVANRESAIPITPAISSDEKNAVFPIRECVVVSAITRMQSDSRSSIFGERIHSIRCRKKAFHVPATRSESPAMRSPIPIASVISSSPAKWFRLA